MSIATPPSTNSPRRCIAYIDGFNFYYNAVAGTQFKWLNFEKLIRAIRNNDDVQKIYYFTALCSGRAPQKRQQTYWRALETLPLLEIVKGRHKEKDRTCFVTGCTFNGSRVFKSIEEKRTDVSIAIQMLDDAYQDACDIFVLVSGDSDLVPVIERIRQRFPHKEVTVYVPNMTNQDGHHEIREVAHKEKNLPLNVLKHSQFPSVVEGIDGERLRKPDNW